MAKVQRGTTDICRHCKEKVTFENWNGFNNHWVHSEGVKRIHCTEPPEDADYNQKRNSVQGAPSSYCWERTASYGGILGGHCGVEIRDVNPYFACGRHIKDAQATARHDADIELRREIQTWEQSENDRLNEHLKKVLGSERDIHGNFRYRISSYNSADQITVSTRFLLEKLGKPYQPEQILTPDILMDLRPLEEGDFE